MDVPHIRKFPTPFEDKKDLIKKHLREYNAVGSSWSQTRRPNLGRVWMEFPPLDNSLFNLPQGLPPLSVKAVLNRRNDSHDEPVVSAEKKVRGKRDRIDSLEDGESIFAPERRLKSPRSEGPNYTLYPPPSVKALRPPLLPTPRQLDYDYGCSSSTFDSRKQACRLNRELLPISREEARKFCQSEKFVQYCTEISSSFLAEDGYLLYCPRGILNEEGVFCYMNSVLQALGNLPQFSLGVVCSAPKEDGSLLNALAEIYQHCWARPKDVVTEVSDCSPLTAASVRAYYACKHANKFDPQKQQDAEEFLEDLVDRLEKETESHGQGSEGDNPVTKMFRGYFQRRDGKKDVFYTLRLGIEDESVTSVKSAFFNHVSLQMNGESQPKLDKNQLANVSSNGSSPTSDTPLANVPRTEAFTSTPVNCSQYRTEEATEPGISQTDKNITEDRGWLSLENSTASSELDCKFPALSLQSVGQDDSGQDCSVELQEVLPTRISEDSAGPGVPDKDAPRNTPGIHVPDVLCLSLVRRIKNDSYNRKQIKADQFLIIPAGFLVGDIPKNTTYKLMSSIHYVCMGVSCGHYYTCTDTGRGDCFKLDDSMVYRGPRAAVCHKLRGQHSMLIYAKVPWSS